MIRYNICNKISSFFYSIFYNQNKPSIDKNHLLEEKYNIKKQFIDEEKYNIKKQIIDEEKYNVKKQIIDEEKYNVKKQIIDEKKQFIDEKKEIKSNISNEFDSLLIDIDEEDYEIITLLKN
jgi:hypothetical protein